MSQWWHRAACKDQDTNIFFPEKETARAPRARQWCRDCPVQKECLDDAMRHEDPMASRPGIFGGLNGAERDRLYRGVPLLELVG